MQSVRITTAMREAILRAMIRHRFAKELASLVKERADFAKAVYDDIYKAKDRKAVRPVAGMPPLPKLPADGDAAGMSRVLEICRPLPEQKDAA